MGIYRTSLIYTGHNFEYGKWYNVAGSFNELKNEMKLYIGGKEV